MQLKQWGDGEQRRREQRGSKTGEVERKGNVSPMSAGRLREVRVQDAD